MHFLFDAQMPKRLAKGLEILDQENVDYKVKITQISHVEVLMGENIKDPEVIHKAAELNAILVSEDDDFYRIKANKALVKKLKVGYVLYKPPKHGSRYWEKTEAFILGWEKLKDRIKKADKPFIFKINRDGEITDESL